MTGCSFTGRVLRFGLRSSERRRKVIGRLSRKLLVFRSRRRQSCLLASLRQAISSKITETHLQPSKRGLVLQDISVTSDGLIGVDAMVASVRGGVSFPDDSEKTSCLGSRIMGEYCFRNDIMKHGCISFSSCTSYEFPVFFSSLWMEPVFFSYQK